MNVSPSAAARRRRNQPSSISILYSSTYLVQRPAYSPRPLAMARLKSSGLSWHLRLQVRRWYSGKLSHRPRTLLSPAICTMTAAALMPSPMAAWEPNTTHPRK